MSTLPWVEKYRPSSIAEVAHQEEVTSALKNSLEQSGHNLPHLLFYGPPGTGKTSVCVALAKQLFGPLVKERLLELNASDERGINVIRVKVKRFAQVAVGAKTVEGFPCPRFKMIVLDEADSMTADAQAALRRTMETYSKVTRFCLVCNYITRIIEPLASRCAKFRFQPIARDAHVARLRTIRDAESVPCEDAVLGTLADVAEGDLRRSITLLQSCTRFTKESLAADVVLQVAGVVPASRVAAFLQALREDTLDAALSNVQELELEGYGAMVLPPLLTEIVRADVPDAKKAKCCDRLGLADARLCDGVDEHIQLRWVAAELHSIFHA